VRTLFLVGRAFETYGGAAITAVALARRLEHDHDHQCAIYSRDSQVRTEQRSGMDVTTYRDLDELRQLVATWRPDAIVGTLHDATDAVRIAKRYAVPSVVYLQDYHFCEPADDEKKMWQLPPVNRYADADEARYVIQAADALFACSRYLQNFVGSRRGRRPELLRCQFDPVEGALAPAAERQRSYVTALCGFRHKGLDVFLRIAELLPAEQFLLVGEPGRDIALSYLPIIARHANVTLGGRMEPKQFLAMSRVVLVPSQWAEPFGRIAVEAMAHGVPTLVSLIGGLAEIVTDASMAVARYQNPEEWARRLTVILRSKELQAAYAADGLRRARPFLEARPALTLERKLTELCRGRTAQRRKLVTFNSRPDGIESNVIVNLALAPQLAAHGYETIAGYDHWLVPDHAIEHDYCRDFVAFEAAASGYRIAIRSWDWGPYPRTWVERLNTSYDQLWVHSRWTEAHALGSGVSPAIVRRVGHGVDLDTFRPDGPLHPLHGRRKLMFLFVGGAVLRKGIDILLAAYRRAFSAASDVCLVIKDDTQNAFFAGCSHAAEIKAMARDSACPDSVYLDAHLPIEELAALYRSCDVAVFPYRAEGFVLPALEAMASGTPALVPTMGPTSDYCDARTSFLVPAMRMRLPVHRPMRTALGFPVELQEVEFLEMRVDVLAEHLRNIAALPDEAIGEKAAAGVAIARERFAWRHAGRRAAALLAELEAGGPPRRFRDRREEAARNDRITEAARRLFVERFPDAVIQSAYPEELSSR
jgi:glycosyltransferase involved in cell wall biosynthesis